MIGSWEVHVGDMDQVLHLWRITGGFEKIDTAARVLDNDKVEKKLIYQRFLFNWILIFYILDV